MAYLHRYNRQSSRFPAFFGVVGLICLVLTSLSCSENTPLEIIQEGGRPILISVTPNTAAFGDTNVVVIFEGQGFVPETVAISSGYILASTFLDSTRLEVLMRDEDFTFPEDADPPPTWQQRYLSVSNIAVGGGQSNGVYFDVKHPNSVPEIHSISPSEFRAGLDGAVVEVRGTHFVYGCTLEWDGVIYPMENYYGDTLIRAEFPAAAFAHGKEITVRVINPLPGGGPSNSMTVTVENPVPIYESRTPYNLIAGQGEQTLTIEGTGFAPDTVILWNGEERPSTFVNQYSVTLTLEASELATPGRAHFSLFTPELGGGQTETEEISFHLEFGDHVNFLVYDSGRDRIYLAISDEGRNNANSVVSVDPATGDFLAVLTRGNNPSTLALTDDGDYLYIGFRGDRTIRRIHLSGSDEDLDFSVDENISSEMYAFDMVPMVDAPNSIAVLAKVEDSTYSNYVYIYDEGIRRVSRDSKSLYLFTTSIEPTSDPLLLLSCARVLDNSLMEILITPEGTIAGESYNNQSEDESLLDLHVIGDRVYSDSGYVFDEGTMEMLGQFDASGPMTIDSDASQAYFLSRFGTNNYNGLKVFDLESRELVGEVGLEQWTEYDKQNLVKVGAEGLAFLTREKAVWLFRDEMFGVR